VHTFLFDNIFSLLKNSNIVFLCNTIIQLVGLRRLSYSGPHYLITRHSFLRLALNLEILFFMKFLKCIY